MAQPQIVPQQDLMLKVAGLHTLPNSLSSVPEGALTIADNIVIDRDNCAEVRRGRDFYGTQLTTGTSLIQNIYQYKKTLLTRYNNTLAYDSNGLGTWVNYSGTFANPDTNYTCQSAQANSNFYITTASGVLKLDSVTATPTTAGVVRALGGSLALTGGSGFLANNGQVLYRIAWTHTDANNNVVIGAPSEQLTIGNSSGGSRNVNVTFVIPQGIDTTYTYRIYRSKQTTSLSIPPDDDTFLTFEATPTSGELIAGVITVTDITDESLLSTPLYTNPSLEGILLSNYQPPFAKVINTFKQSVFYCNTINKQSINLQLLAVGGASGLQINDTITIDGVVYVAKGAENTATGEFLLDTSGTPGENIESTTRSLINVINLYASNTSVYGYYTSGFTDTPGKFQVQRRDNNTTAFYITSSRDVWTPELPTSGTTVSSSNSIAANGASFSKSQQPEAVPIGYQIKMGSADEPITQALPLRDALIIFKTDGNYRITGTGPSDFQSLLFDSSAILNFPNTAVVLNNLIYAFTTQGVVEIDGNDVKIISRPIEKELFALASLPNFNLSFAIAYESDRKYILFVPNDQADQSPTLAYVYNVITDTWTNWTMGDISAGLVKAANDKLYTAQGTQPTAYLFEERKSNTKADYADEQYIVNITAYNHFILTVDDTTNISEGDLIYQLTAQSKVVQVINSTTLEVENDYVWEIGPASVIKPIGWEMQWVPQSAGNPGFVKTFRDVIFFTRDSTYETVTAGFATNFTQEGSTYDIDLHPVTSDGGWGDAPWGDTPWGDAGGAGQQALRTWTPLECRKANWLLVKLSGNEVYQSFGLEGLSINLEQISPRFR